MIQAPLTAYDVRYVLAHLWERGERELALLGVSKDDANQFVLDCQAAGRMAQVLRDGDVPVVIFGTGTDAAGVFTWFQATDKFDDYALPITRAIRREAATLGPTSIYSLCLVPSAARWFRTLGFVEDLDYRKTLDSGATQYRFYRR